MRKASYFTLPLALAIGALAAEAPAQQSANPKGCAPRSQIVEYLAHKYGETLKGAGRQEPKAVMELYVSAKGTWSVIVTRPDGISCPVAVGDNWRDVDFNIVKAKNLTL